MEIKQTTSIVIVNFNAGPGLEVCVKKALAQANEVIVVDNGSQDGSLAPLDLIAAQGLPLRLIRTGENLGFSKACNIGAEEAAGPFLLFLNPDCELEDGAVETLRQALEAGPAAGMVGGLLLNEDGSEQIGARRRIPTPWRSFVTGFGLGRLSRFAPEWFADYHLANAALPTGPTAVEAISGACMYLRRDDFESVGEFDEAYFMHCEDLDLCMRIRNRGWKILFVPAARMVHFKGTCSRSRPIFVEWHKHRGMFRFYNKFFRTGVAKYFVGLIAIGVSARFVLVAGRHLAKRPLALLGGKSG